MIHIPRPRCKEEVHRVRSARKHTKIINKPLYPGTFLRCFRSSDVLSFHHRVCDRIFLGTLRAYCSSIQSEDKFRLRAVIVFIGLEASVGVIIYKELFRASIDKKNIYLVLLKCFRIFLTAVQ